MLIVCPSCATSYDVGLTSLSPNGRQVRCARCRAVWHAELSTSEKLVAAAAAIARQHDFAEQTADTAADGAGVSAAEAAAETTGAVSSDQAAELAAIGEQATEQHEPSSPATEASSANGGGDAADEVEAPPIVPADVGDSEPPIEVAPQDSLELAGEPTEDIETVAARRLRRSATRRSLRWPLSRTQSAILALALIDIILIGWRSDVVRALPQTASFYASLGLPVNLRGLTFADVVTATEQHEGVPILVVEGNIVNGSRKVEDVPRLKFVVRNAARQEIYSWTAVPSRNALPPSEAVSFRARLASPPPDAHDLILRFVNRRDILTGTH